MNQVARTTMISSPRPCARPADRKPPVFLSVAALSCPLAQRRPYLAGSAPFRVPRFFQSLRTPLPPESPAGGQDDRFSGPGSARAAARGPKERVPPPDAPQSSAQQDRSTGPEEAGHPSPHDEDVELTVVVCWMLALLVVLVALAFAAPALVIQMF